MLTGITSLFTSTPDKKSIKKHFSKLYKKGKINKDTRPLYDWALKNSFPLPKGVGKKSMNEAIKECLLHWKSLKNEWVKERQIILNTAQTFLGQNSTISRKRSLGYRWGQKNDFPLPPDRCKKSISKATLQCLAHWYELGVEAGDFKPIKG
jgi:hypothetical protein